MIHDALRAFACPLKTHNTHTEHVPPSSHTHTQHPGHQQEEQGLVAPPLPPSPPKAKRPSLNDAPFPTHPPTLPTQQQQSPPQANHAAAPAPPPPDAGAHAGPGRFLPCRHPALLLLLFFPVGPPPWAAATHR